MLTQAVATILRRELLALRRELEAYPDERQIWQLVPGLPNSAGTLALHLAGNLQHYIGARLGRSGYVRDRAAEFSRRDVARDELVAEIEAARTAVAAGLADVSAETLAADFPELFGGARVRTDEYLVHLVSHCAYHLGQVDYHRHIVTGSGEGVGAVRPAELSTVRPDSPAGPAA